jgi:hypothetical protein
VVTPRWALFGELLEHLAAKGYQFVRVRRVAQSGGKTEMNVGVQDTQRICDHRGRTGFLAFLSGWLLLGAQVRAEIYGRATTPAGPLRWHAFVWAELANRDTQRPTDRPLHTVEAWRCDPRAKPDEQCQLLGIYSKGKPGPSTPPP